MAFPKQIEEAAQLAEELHERMFSSDSQEESTNDEDVDELEDDTSDEGDSDEAVDEEEEEYDVPEDDDITELKKFKARYLSLKGKYDAEVPRLQHDLRSMKEDVFEKIEAMRQQQAPQTQTPKEQTKLDKFREEYGEDFVDSLKELFKAEVDPLLQSTLKPVQDQVSSVEETQIKVAKENFKNYLDQQVKGDWRELWDGKDPKFIEFLQKPDPSGLYTYSDLVQLYNDNWDADKLSTVLNTYLESKNVSTPAPKAPNKQREALVAPSRNNVHSTPNTGDKRIWTQDAIRNFEREDRQNKYTLEQSQALWTDLMSAMGEGRIR